MAEASEKNAQLMDAEVISYADRWSLDPGDGLGLKVSTTAASFDARLVRLSVRSTGPELPAVTVHPVDERRQVRSPGREQRATAGSCIVVDLREAREPPPESFTVTMWIYTRTPGAGVEQGLAGILRNGAHDGWAVYLDPDGVPSFKLIVEERVQTLALTRAVPPRRWSFLAASFDARSGTVRLVQQVLRPSPREPTVLQATAEAPSHGRVWGSGPLVLAALGFNQDGGRLRSLGHFTGKLESPAVYAGALDDTELGRIAAGAGLEDKRYAAWDFSRSFTGDRAHDIGRFSLHGRIVNHPMRAVTGHAWTGETDDYRAAPEQYAALHFHADDLEDAGWTDDVELRLPSEIHSGVYAAEVRAEGATDLLPVFVRPAAEGPRSRVAVLLPTYTYLAYANERIALAGDFAESGYSSRETRLGPADHWLDRHPELGRSLYDLHPDGSGVCYSSRLRPIPNMRPGYTNWTTHAPRHFGLDLYLIGWLDHTGIEYDVVTDEDLHAEGIDLLRPYQVVMTGSHPEYATRPMLDALDAYLAERGRLMYLGGNGFFWVTTIDPERPHVVEVRRGQSGSRPWESAPGEDRSPSTGERGGLWRHRGRPPNALVGVGFTAQGWDQKAPGYRRLPDSHAASARWIFDGVGGSEVIGDFGFSMDGAASDEVDRYDADLGSPPHALRLATSTGHSRIYRLGLEDMLMNAPGAHGEADERVRADMVFFETAGGGAVFSVGAIGWIGSLPVNGFSNNVSTVTGNVLRGFLEPEDSAPWALGRQ